MSYLNKNLRKRSIIFIITDLQGLENIDVKLLNEINTHNDVLLINISDACMYGKNLYDLNNNNYIPSFLSNNLELEKIEKDIKKEIYDKIKQKIKMDIVSINGLDEINLKVIELLERHKYAGIN